MNRQWMYDKLEEFGRLAKLYDDSIPVGYSLGNEGRRSDLYRAEPTARKILERLDHRLAAKLDLGRPAGEAEAIGIVNQALGILEDENEWAANLGSDAPTIAADKLHQWIWAPAQTFWESEHYRAAVDAAARAINAHTQKKIGRKDIHDDDLMNQAFAEKPKSGQKYLRWPGDPEDKTVKSRNNALRPFAQGCIAGIRNPAAHEHGDDWDEHEALEKLAALSILARWIDECEVRVGA
ncbi:TIGR02391 family protein [Mycobacteroides abscessus]|uniref:TIGR02391 family protein n=1 Tax=Mycobacteroides abscessus TaxID=36809 RepID=UPI0009A9117F|nr:TIGR02391 family protein [Mycobacteroides abscessus]SKD36121.1 TIGR02391 family protein [Mycobacteroides abscessus subsp. massiliense]SKD47453.1 TIGR02391 family protein [Mycobacteroides abscessus subsp. massiliense]SKD59283.1 TIGR02391 family protein [Mycobacteroides abscessus subsp. massiliense]